VIPVLGYLEYVAERQVIGAYNKPHRGV